MTPETTDVLDSTINRKLDELLIRWHRHTTGYQLTSGWAGTSGMFRHAPEGRRYYDPEGQREQELKRGEKFSMDRITFCIYQLEQPWRNCIQIEARNLCSKAAVWTSALLPSNKAELEVVRLEARNRVSRLLLDAGLLV